MKKGPRPVNETPNRSVVSWWMRPHWVIVFGAAVITLMAVVARANAQEAPTAHFVGALHEHSGYSDGAPGTQPRDYFAQGKARGLDFVGSAEHSDNADLPITVNDDCLSDALPSCAVADDDAPEDSFRKWDATAEQAAAATDETFTAFRGYEWTSDRFGHINVFFSKHDANAKIDGGYAVTMESFWTWFAMRPELGGGADGLATFNHPGREDTAKDLVDDPAYTWDDFAYRPEADDRVVGLEVFGKGSEYDSDGPGGSWLAYALDKGWHVAPVGAEDHHGTDWAAADLPKTILIARDRSAESLGEAMLARRMYAVAQDWNDLRIEMTVDGEPMGSRLTADPGTALPLTATVTRVGGEPFEGTIEVVGPGNALLETASGFEIATSVPAADAETYVFLRVRDAGGRPVLFSSPVWVRPSAWPLVGTWVAGDLHVHTTYSHDVWGPVDDDNTGPEELYTLGWSVDGQFALAATRGLDYLAISDHNDIRAHADPGFGAHGVLPIHAYEKSIGGHAQMLGARRIYEKPGESQSDVESIANALRADGGVFQINHPTGDSVDFPSDADWRLARDGYDGDVRPDAVEVWNIQWLWQPPFPSSNSIDDAVRYWEGWMSRGDRVTATGGSDNHWLSTAAIQGVGQPTTWVYVTERSEKGILEGIEAGRTTISWQPPAMQGARVFLEADRDGDGVWDAMSGDTVPLEGTRFRVRVDAAPPGSFVRLVTSAGEVLRAPATVTGVALETSLEAAELAPNAAGWVRADLLVEDAPDARAQVCDDAVGDQTPYCRNRLAVLAMTSAIYVE